MGYNLNAGDEVEIVYENDAGETKETHGTVEANDPWGNGKVKIKRGTGRTAHRISLYPDGTLRAAPYYNANGKGEDGVLKDLKLKGDA